jgi:hypothetical protein
VRRRGAARRGAARRPNSPDAIFEPELASWMPQLESEMSVTPKQK